MNRSSQGFRGRRWLPAAVLLGIVGLGVGLVFWGEDSSDPKAVESTIPGETTELALEGSGTGIGSTAETKPAPSGVFPETVHLPAKRPGGTTKSTVGGTDEDPVLRPGEVIRRQPVADREPGEEFHPGRFRSGVPAERVSLAAGDRNEIRPWVTPVSPGEDVPTGPLPPDAERKVVADPDSDKETEGSVPLRLIVTSEPLTGVEVSVNGFPGGIAPFELDLRAMPSDRLTVTGRKAGYAETVATILLGDDFVGGTKTVRLEMRPDLPRPFRTDPETEEGS